jgi:Tol biopolymer transport system component
LNYAPSCHPAISDDGQFVAFKTGWTNGATAPGGSGVAAVIVFQYDSSTGSATNICTNGFPAWPQNDDVYGPEMSPDGRFIVFVATNKSAACLTVQLWDAQAGTNQVVSVAMNGSLPTNSISDTPAVTPDGSYVVFMSNATNLTGNVVSNGFHIYCRNVQAGTTQLIDVDTNGVGSVNPVKTIPGISADGQFVAFECLDGGLVSGDNNQAFDVFVRDLGGGTTELISQCCPGLIPQTGDGLSLLAQYCLSDDGRKIVFTSYADDLVPNDFNGTSDVFAFDLTASTNMLVSVGTDGKSAAGSSYSPALSLDGQLVVFLSTATNLVAGRTNLFVNVFLRDLQAGTNALVSVAPDGITPGNGDAAAPAISQDGRYVVFVSRASNLAAGASASYANTYFRDLASGTTTLLTNNSPTTLTPSISADGRYIAYFGSGSQVMVRDTQSGTNVFATNAVVSAAVSPSGACLLYYNATTLSVINLLNKSNLFSMPANVPIRNPSPWSADGRFFAFVTATNAVPNDTNGTNDVYLYDLLAGSLTLVSVNSSQTASANGASDWPAVSGDGHFVIYRSFATDIVAGNTNPPPNVFLFDRCAGSNSLLTSASPGSTWSSWNAKPMINGDGRIVAFQSWNPGLVAGDLNRVADVIAGTLQPWGTIDSDGDGIPDLWMMHYFGHPTGQASDLSLAQDDADGNGMSNLEKFLAGLDPTDPASILSVQIQALVSATNNAMNNVTLSWPAVPGKNYQVQYKHNLNDSVWLEVPGAAVVGNQGSLTVPADQSSRYYRVTAN